MCRLTPAMMEVEENVNSQFQDHLGGKHSLAVKRVSSTVYLNPPSRKFMSLPFDFLTDLMEWSCLADLNMENEL